QIAQGDLEGAELTANILLEKDPENPVVHNLLGSIAAAGQDEERAIRHFNDAVLFNPDYIPAQMNLVKLDIASKRYKPAAERLDAILEKDPRSREAMKGHAHLSELKGDIDKSIWWLERLWSFYPGAETEPAQIIKLYISQENYKKALFSAKKYYEYHSSKFNVLKSLVNTYHLAGENDKAVELLKYKLKYPDQFNTIQLYELAELQLNTGDKNGAYSTMLKINDRSPDFTPAKYGLVRLESQFGNYARSLKLIEEIRVAEGDSGLLESLRGDVLVFSGKENEALDVFIEANRKFPDTELQLKLFRLRMKMGKDGEALDELDAWVRQNPDDLDAVYGLAIAFIDSSQYEKSVTLHEELLEKTRNDPSIMNNLAWLYQKTGDQRALEYIEMAYARNPEDPSILDTYGWILTESGRPKEGLNYLRLAMSMDANNPSIQYHLALALKSLNRTKEATELLDDLLLNHSYFREKADAEILRKNLDS
ncbi:MAG: tetratricopeptide repeat protein, partial [Thiotrichales bacterium]|nr:tetratricopeptide repeat protein [Thiotrichales bacterium]